MLGDKAARCAFSYGTVVLAVAVLAGLGALWAVVSNRLHGVLVGRLALDAGSAGLCTDEPSALCDELTPGAERTELVRTRQACVLCWLAEAEREILRGHGSRVSPSIPGDRMSCARP